METTVAIVDDHELIARALGTLINSLEGYRVLFEVSSGKRLIDTVEQGMQPDIVLLDVSMPVMTGYEVAEYLQTHHPAIKVIALSMDDKEEAIVRMIRHGVRGYLVKGCSTTELKRALDTVVTKGVYYSEFLTSKLVQNLKLKSVAHQQQRSELSEREIRFIQLASSELTYAEIADRLCVSPRTVDGYREALFTKLGVKTRVGLVLEAIRLKIVHVS